MNRRRAIQTALAGTAAAFASCQPGAPGEAPDTDLFSSKDKRYLAQFPQKAPLILLTDRPPQLETPLTYFRKDLTPNEAHFVRWHLAGVPKSVSLKAWRLTVDGNVKHPQAINFDELEHKFEPVSLIALNQCSGNGRSLFSPRVPGGQWRHGAMGNAKWTGARLRDILERAGVKEKTVEVSFRGLDDPAIDGPPPFEKSIPLDLAQNPDVLVAYTMNGTPLPMLNGFPARLVVPGWYATYWVKSLTKITVRTEPLHSFWMEKAYRIPGNAQAEETASNLAAATVPIYKMAMHSIFVVPEPGAPLRAGYRNELQGLVTHGGQGVSKVEVSVDGGAQWAEAKLDGELGKYAWRRWRGSWTPPARGEYKLMVRATGADGSTQLAGQWNRSGYQRNDIEHMLVRAI